MKTLLAVLALFAAALVANPWAPARAQDANAFSDEQTKAIEQIVRDYLIANPGIMREVFDALEQQEERERQEQVLAAIETNADELFRHPDDPVIGNPVGDITLVEFFDYNCGFCKRALDDLVALVEEDANLRVVMKEFPILTPGSIEAAQVSIAAAKQGRYWDFHSKLLSVRGEANRDRSLKLAEELGLDMEQLAKDMADPKVVQMIQSTQDLAESLGINGTPSYVIGDAVISGAVGADELRQAIADARSSACRTC